MNNSYHIPALLRQSIEGLNIKPEGTYVDVTFGGGGHSLAILKQLNSNGKLIAFDQDLDTLQNAINDNRLTFVYSNFRYLKNFLYYHGIKKVDGILADLGVSSHHFDDAERGFSFRFDGDLDMRMNKNAKLKASDILNTYNEEKLSDIFYLYGEMRNSRAIAKAIVKARANEQIKSIFQFIEILKPFFNREQEKKDMARIFQALRIEVNNEMKVLKEMLKQSQDMLNENGRLVVITYHSLEDRLVKNFIRSNNFEGKIEKDFFGNVLNSFNTINNKVIVPDENEIKNNPRARSAKLRIAERRKNHV